MSDCLSVSLLVAECWRASKYIYTYTHRNTGIHTVHGTPCLFAHLTVFTVYTFRKKRGEKKKLLHYVDFTVQTTVFRLLNPAAANLIQYLLHVVST